MTGTTTPHPTAHPTEACWLADTLTRAQLRYGLALHDLSTVPALLALARLHSSPQHADVRESVESIGATLRAAIDELGLVCLYLDAVAKPYLVHCTACGARLSDFPTYQGLQHYREAFGRAEIYSAGHDPQPAYTPPDRTEWAALDTDLTDDRATRTCP